MAIAHDAASESHTGSDGNKNAASFSWTHTPAGTPKGVLVFTFTMASTTEHALSVTYGGEALAEVAGGRAVDTAGEPGSCKAWFLGTGVPTGPQTVVVNRTNDSVEMYAVCCTVTSGGDADVAGVVLLQENQALTERQIDDGSPGTNSVRYAGTYSGASTPPPPGANSTMLHWIVLNFGAISCMTVRETTAGQGSRPVGFSASADDVAAVHLAVLEVAAAPTAAAGVIFMY